MNIISFCHLFVCDLEQYCTFGYFTYHISTCEGSILCYETCIIETEMVKVSFDKKNWSHIIFYEGQCHIIRCHDITAGVWYNLKIHKFISHTYRYSGPSTWQGQYHFLHSQTPHGLHLWPFGPPPLPCQIQKTCLSPTEIKTDTFKKERENHHLRVWTNKPPIWTFESFLREGRWKYMLGFVWIRFGG